MRSAPGLAPSTLARLPAVALALLYLFTGFALAGYATFGRHPALLARLPQVTPFYGISFHFFAQAHVWIAWSTLVVILTRYAGARWLPAFVALYLISLGSELLGTGAGIPFGAYRYTQALGPRWLGHVPVVIPLSWFFMALPSYALVRRALPRRPVARVLAASLLLLSWDLALDPAMSRATAYWVWEQPGAYYGMPWLNLFGWYLTGLALMAALALLRAEGWIATLPTRWLCGFYGANLLLPLGMAAAAGLWGAVAGTLAALAGAVLLTWWLAWRSRSRAAWVEAAT